MDKRYGWLVMGALSLSLTACATVQNWWKPAPKTAAAAAPARVMGTRQEFLPKFASIEADGWFDIDIIQDTAHYSITVQGYNDIISHMQPVVKDGVLHLHMDKFYGKAEEQQIHVVIRMPTLRHLRYSGDATIRAEKMDTGYLDVEMQRAGDLRLGGKVALHNVTVGGTGKLHLSNVNSHELYLNLAGNAMLDLEGRIRLCEVHAADDSWLRLHWVDSPRVKAFLTHRAKVTLAGHTDLLQSNVYDHAVLDAKYLRAEKAFVKTFQYALAEINTIQSRSTIARHASNIYYYSDPNFAGDFMAHDGSVLDMQYIYLTDRLHRLPLGEPMDYPWA